MDPALNAIIGPWAQLGIVGSIVLALGATVYLQWQHIKACSAAHLADVKAFGENALLYVLRCVLRIVTGYRLKR